MTTPTPKIERWYAGDSDPEELHHETRDEAIEDYLDYFVCEDIPTTVTVRGYARKRPEVTVEDVLHDVYERLGDGEFGNPDDDNPHWDDGNEESEAVRDLAKRLAAAIEDHWEAHGYACEEVHTETVEVAEWRKAWEAGK
jgi:hypothetical protein